MKLRLLLLTTCLFYSTANFAMFCPNGLNQVDIGDTIDQVTHMCGAPTSQKSFKSSIDEPQEWTYYIKMVKGQNGSIKMVIAFKDNKVINMSVNGIGLTNTTICNGKTTTLNTTQDQVKAACGDPAYIDKPDEAEYEKKKDNMTSFTYEGTSSITLLFKDGKLQKQQ